MPLTRITSAAIADGTVIAADIADGTVTGPKLGSGSISGNNLSASAISGNNISINSINASNSIVSGTVTGNLLGFASVSGNNIACNSINASNSIVSGTITGNLLGFASVSGNNLACNSINASNTIRSGTITGNLLGTQSITGNLIGHGSISSNHYAGGGVTSDVLAPNLKISLARAFETATVTSTAAGGTMNIDIADSLIHYYGANSTSAITFNLRGTSSTTFNSLVADGQTVSVVIAVRHGTARHAAALAIDGTTIVNDSTPYATGWKNSIYYTGGIKPTTVAISSAELNVYTYTILKVSSGTYSVLTSNTIFGI